MSAFTDRVTEIVRERIQKIPDHFEARLVVADDVLDVVRMELAQALQPSLNAKLKTMPQTNYGEKQRVSDWTNEILRSLGLAVNANGEPALLKARAGHNPTETGGEYFLETTDDKGHRHHEPKQGGWNELPELTLMPADLSRLSHVEQAAARNR